MRTTLTLDDDVAAEVQRLQRARKLSFKEAVNTALRAGLLQLASPPRRRKRYQLKPVSLGRCKLPTLDDIADVLTILEGDDRP